MANVIDSLIVTLGLDATKFTKGQAEAVKSLKKTEEQSSKTSKELAVHANKSADAFKSVKNELLAIGALLVGGIGLKNFLQNTILQTAALGRMSTNLGMSAQKLSQWQHAAVMAGGTAEGITAALTKAQAATSEIGISGLASPELMATQKYGGKYGFQIDKDMTGEDLLRAQSDILKNLIKEVGIDKAHTIATKEIGMDEGTFNLLKDGKIALQQNIDAQKEVAEAEAKLSKSAEELRKQFEALKNQFMALALDFLPPLIEQIKTFTEVLQAKEFKEYLHEAAMSIKFFYRIISWTSSAIFGFISKFMPFIPGMATLGKALKEAVSEFSKAEKRLEADEDRDKNGGVKLTKSAQERVGSGSPSASSTSLGGSNRSQIIGKLVAMGWTPQQAAGMVGSLQQESNLNPNAMNPDSKMYGIAQWDTNRRNDFKDWAATRKTSSKVIHGSDIDDQLRFMNYELTEGKEKRAGDKIRATNTASEAAMAHSTYYERASKAGKWGANDSKRVRNADDSLSEYNSFNANGAGSLPLAFRPRNSNSSSSSTSTTDVNINTINVNTQATDAQGISHSIGNAITNNVKFGVPNANQGLE